MWPASRMTVCRVLTRRHLDAGRQGLDRRRQRARALNAAGLQYEEGFGRGPRGPRGNGDGRPAAHETRRLITDIRAATMTTEMVAHVDAVLASRSPFSWLGTSGAS